ncbi:MAG: hypothetical protein NTW99_15760 [Chloroflexi bacterium]|nr:hypothetical protein [Chloroflexota bacterium]
MRETHPSQHWTTFPSWIRKVVCAHTADEIILLVIGNVCEGILAEDGVGDDD